MNVRLGSKADAEGGELAVLNVEILFGSGCSQIFRGGAFDIDFAVRFSKFIDSTVEKHV